MKKGYNKNILIISYINLNKENKISSVDIKYTINK